MDVHRLVRVGTPGVLDRVGVDGLLPTLPNTAGRPQ